MHRVSREARALALMGCAFVLGACQTKTSEGLPSPVFEAAANVASVHAQHRRLPEDDIWWSVNGEDMSWNFRNLHQLFPTVNVYRGGRVRTLTPAPMPDIGKYVVDVAGTRITFDEFLESEHSTATGVIVLHQGLVVFERYPRMQDYEMPVFWSVAKVFVGTLVRILEERGELDVSAPIERYLPRLAGSSLAGVPVRDLLDMASGLDCADEYEDRTSCYYRYSMAIGDGFRTADAPDNPYDFAATLETSRHAPPGEVFSYSGLNTFVLAWLVEEITGMPFQDALSRELWYRMGAEANASYIAPRYGIAVTHGGFLARLRDVARFGLLFTPSYGVVSDERLISPEHLALLLHGGRPRLRTNAGLPGADMSGVRHNVYQWDAVLANDTLFKGGWAGQGLIINPTWDVVAAFTGYFKDDDHSEEALAPILLRLLDDVFGSAE
ncbi:MAG: serine hydrolase domain-containing protein [Pseudomonadales bacterium]|jgi:CubicO group peptidase (beta-lactamase class C family)|nr:serine hydrolase domain-containing protein [Pseudomonadales bacterium]|tara:strand:- start:2676 stop:3992 length:1317 start_codon:yes stop_codon:yes gene_type:complete